MALFAIASSSWLPRSFSLAVTASTLVFMACAPQPAPGVLATPALAAAPVASADAPAAVASVPLPAAPPSTPSASDAAKSDAGHDGGPSQVAKDDAIGDVMALKTKLLVVDTVVGTGREAQEGDHVSVHCVGTLADGTVFESSRARKRPLQFVAGGDKVVLGLAEGVVGMRVGGHRTLTVPPALGYGGRGLGTKVPPRATLTFEVELLSVK
jgi:FKBP-type peptidyl-prolyl cis-trans isomerase FkpA